MEKILFKYLFNFVLDRNLLCKHQSGFQPKDSTVNQLIEIYDTIIRNLDKGNDVRFIFCDVSKAFDKVWHQGLLTKLRSYGFNVNRCNWIADYLNDRQQKVVLDGFFSNFASINAGVPQGSVLGPFLFLLYINDITGNLLNIVRLFADDTSLFVIVDNDPQISADALNLDLINLSSWAKDWHISFNAQKTKSLVFTRRNVQHPDVTFDGTSVQNVAEHTHLYGGCKRTYRKKIKS